MSHAVNTFTVAFNTATIAAINKMRLSLAIGICLFVSGVIKSDMRPSLLWFRVANANLAYRPMTYLGIIIALKETM